ncbi:ATPase PilB [Acetivibrio straminisolvens JCM 21531]|uniref:ATPase PilB n=1 Tax=Acetivibrio straminisolvens JCM 21531 TaxID=1294263 RepID=W4V3J7_9FIRM|nr:ATPase PilB [Acetivibrio straminisolvens JCM 21531]
MWGYEMLGVDTRGIDEILLEMGVLKIIDLKKGLGYSKGKQ